MRNVFPWILLITIIFSAYVVPPDAASEPLTIDGSTQLLWGDDLLDDDQSILSQYLRFSYSPEEKNYRIYGYGRVWDDFSGGKIREDDLSGRIYYLYVDYAPKEDRSFRFGRQFVTFTAGSSIIDGLSVDIRNLGPVGVTLSGGTEVTYSLDSDHSAIGDYFTGIDVFLEKIASTQFGVSYVRTYDDGDRAREEFGLNARYFYKSLSPYTDLRYNWLSKSFDEASIGIDFFPIEYLMIKTEFYHSYPTFDSTSIYSVFAVDKYREYYVRADYSLEDTPLVLSVSYVRQLYEDSDNADVYAVGASFNPDKLLVRTSVDYRKGYGGKLWGFEVYGDYTLRKDRILSAGVQYDTYRRPDYSDDDYAQRYWAGGKWIVNDKTSLDARLEANVNQNFEHNILGRISLDWQL